MKRTSTASLPPMFLLVAEAALTSGGTDGSVPSRLQEMAADIAEILTPENLIERDRDLVCVADDLSKRTFHGCGQSSSESFRDDVLKLLATGGATDSNIYGAYIGALRYALEVGLVAGHLITRALADAGSAR